MRETSRDDKWQAEREANDRRRDEHVADDSKAAADAADIASETTAAASGAASQPSETELVIVALLMRIYDIQMAQLTLMDEATANRIYEAHEKGGTFNPPIFIPTMTESGTTENSDDAGL